MAVASKERTHSLVARKHTEHPLEKSQHRLPMLGEYYALKKTDPAKAREKLLAVIQANPENIVAQREMGNLFFKKKKYKEALPFFDAAVKLNPSDDKIHARLGYIHYKTGNPEQALVHLKSAIKLKPADYKHQFQLGYVLRHLGRNKEAQIYLQRAIDSKNPKIVAGSLREIEKLRKKKQKSSPAMSQSDSTTSLALVTYSQTIAPAIQENDSAATINAELDNYYQLKKSNPAAAKTKLAEIIAAHPNNIEAQKEMGYLLLAEKNNAEALKHFQIAVQMEPKDKEIQMQIGYLLDDLGRKQEALRYYQAAANLDPKNEETQLQIGYTLESLGKKKEAFNYFATAVRLKPKDYSAQLQLGYSFEALGKSQEALSHFKLAANSPDAKIRAQSIKAINGLASEENTKESESNTLLDKFYNLQKIDPCGAEQALIELLVKEPNNLTALKEMAYFLSDQKRYAEAVCYFKAAQRVKPCEYKLALEIANTLDELKRYLAAYQQYEYATNTCDCKDRLTAREAMIDTVPHIIKFLPDPFFIDYYDSPYAIYRFRDIIRYSQLRFGVTYGCNKQGELYGTIYYSNDSRSHAGLSPAIYSDDSVLYAIGTRYYPFDRDKVPLFLYLEAGRAYYLVNQEMPGIGDWQGDLRGGIDFFKDWGAKHTYADCFRFTFKHVGDIYGDFSYFSRYQRDWIGQLRIREGVRIAEFKNSALTVYLRGQYVWDTQQFFYNNTLEFGPGIVFTPDNRIDLALRAELTRGYYIPVNSPDVNPYGRFYNGNIAQVELYLRF